MSFLVLDWVWGKQTEEYQVEKTDDSERKAFFQEYNEKQQELSRQRQQVEDRLEGMYGVERRLEQADQESARLQRELQALRESAVISLRTWDTAWGPHSPNFLSATRPWPLRDDSLGHNETPRPTTPRRRAHPASGAAKVPPRRRDPADDPRRDPACQWRAGDRVQERFDDHVRRPRPRVWSRHGRD